MNGAALRISRTHFPVTALGPGVRLGVWVQGCPLACRGCMARDTWDAGGGTAVDVEELAGRWREAIRRGASGLTVSGGEPLAQAGPLAAFLEAAHRVRAEADGEYDILMFTGYEPEELDARQRRAAGYADVLVTGRFEAAAPTALIWRGSANQRMLPQSDLGRRRYAAHVDHEPERPPVQLRADGTGAWIVGVPRRGTLAALDRALRAGHLDADRVSWRAAPAQEPEREPCSGTGGSTAGPAPSHPATDPANDPGT